MGLVDRSHRASRVESRLSGLLFSTNRSWDLTPSFHIIMFKSTHICVACVGYWVLILFELVLQWTRFVRSLALL